MAEFKPHWADKLELTIDRHEYQKLLDKPTKQVKQILIDIEPRNPRLLPPTPARKRLLFNKRQVFF